MNTKVVPLFITSVGQDKHYDFEIQFTGLPVVLAPNGNYKNSIAVDSFTYTYDWYNISSIQQNNIFRYYNGTTWKNITLSDGIYQLSQLTDEIYRVFRVNGDFDNSDPDKPVYYITLNPDFSTGKLDIVLANSYQVDFSFNTQTTGLGYILGFDPVLLSGNGTYTGTHIVNISNDINQIFLHCSLVGNDASYYNGNSSNIIYSDTPNLPPQSVVTRDVVNRIPIEIITNRFQSIRFQLKDNLGRFVLTQNPITIRLVLQGIQ